MRKVLVIGLCSILMAVAAAPAFANSTPSQGTYGGTGANQLSQVQSVAANNNTSTASTSAGSLPFTGLNVGLVAVVAVALLGAGFALRLRSRSDES
jgi:hypothetical protein